MTLKTIWNHIASAVRRRFWPNTLSFAFMMVFINGFMAVFGPENSMLAVSLVILMPASTVRDMTAAPVKHFCLQALILELMVTAAFLVQILPPAAALPVNLAALLVVFYAYTYEYSSSMYFPYILSYLFFVFLSPLTAAQMPKRMLAALVGAACIMAYQFYGNRRRMAETADDRLTAMLEQTRRAAEHRRTGGGGFDPAPARESVRVISRAVYERRKKALRISDAGFALVDAGRTLEYLMLLIGELPDPLSPTQDDFLARLGPWLDGCRDYVQRRRPDVPVPDWGADAPAALAHAAEHLQGRLAHMADREKRLSFRPTGLSLGVRLQAVLDVSGVRAAYAVRAAVLLAVFTFLVQVLHLEHGRWLLFTIASLTLPYADDIGVKAKKRILGTLVGGAASVVLFSLFPGQGARTFFMMFSGYLNGFFTDYAQTYSCATVGALGGAVLMTAFGPGPVSAMVGLRLAYILAGALIALLFNCLLLPFTRKRATRALADKYVRLSELLAQVCAGPETDSQLYYSLVLQTQLTEEKLCQNAGLDGRTRELLPVLADCRRRVREAHLAAASSAV